MKPIRRNDQNKPLMTYRPIRSIFDDFFRVPEVFDDFFSSNVRGNLSADMWEENDALYIKMALPGLTSEDINISITGDMVTIKGESKKEEKEDEKKFYYKSMNTYFEQIFNLPTKVNSDEAEANFENGILTLKLPKSEDVKPKKIKINSK